MMALLESVASEDVWNWLWTTDGFVPRAICGRGWTPELVELATRANEVIWYCYIYLAIAAAAAWKFKLHLTKTTGLLSFGFILSCGWTHQSQAMMFRNPAYHYDVVAHVTCAALSVATVTAVTVSAWRQLRGTDWIRHV